MRQTLSELQLREHQHMDNEVALSDIAWRSLY